jgi:hypothetical protein
MEWKDLASSIGKFAPLIGTVIGGPAGAAVGALVSASLGTDNDPSAVQQALVSNPEVALKLAQLEADQRVQLQTLAVTAEQNRLQAETSQLASVNTTMQSESASNHWPTYSWRPFIGFVFGTMAFGVYFVLPLLHIPPPTVPFEMWGAFGAILGVASWYRGKMQADPAIPTDNKG